MIRSPAVALSLVLAVTVVHLNSLRFAEKMRDADIIEPTIPEHLVVWDPVEVNFTRRVRLDDSGRIYTMRTMATNPPIFEIEDFLTGEECETILSLAGKQGLFKSDHTYLDGSNLAEKDKDTTQLSEDEANNLFRFSDQTWLAHDSHRHLRSMYRRLQRLARLPDHVMPQVEQMQVVRYNRHGHYESHFDSEADHLGPCCIDPVARGFDTGVRALERPLEKRCRLCRYMTVLYYLVDTEQGGGTVFPLADTTDAEYTNWTKRTDPLKYRQTRTCGPGKVVLPKRGKAIMWYNHHTDRGHLGQLHERSLHGGCNVIKGQKWIANHWISELPHPDVPRTPATGHV